MRRALLLLLMAAAGSAEAQIDPPARGAALQAPFSIDLRAAPLERAIEVISMAVGQPITLHPLARGALSVRIEGERDPGAILDALDGALAALDLTVQPGADGGWEVLPIEIQRAPSSRRCRRRFLRSAG